MPYPEIMIRPMREDLTRLGVEELKTADAVDETIRNSKGTLMVVVNSICGCAAGKARPGRGARAATRRETGQGCDCFRRRRYRSYGKSTQLLHRLWTIIAVDCAAERW